MNFRIAANAIIALLFLAGPAGAQQPRRLPYVNVYPFPRLLRAADLAGTSSWERRLIRNAIFARHGRAFQDPQLARFFQRRRWYRADRNWSGEQGLSPMEKQNARFLLDYEKGQPATDSAAAENRAPGSNAAREAAFVKAVPPYATLVQIKKLLPPGTRYSKPEVVFGEHAQGTHIEFRGRINGSLFFLSDEQSSVFRDGTTDQELHSSRLRYSPSDPIHKMWVIMDNGTCRKDSDNLARIRAVSRSLGRPSKREYVRQEEVDVGNGGWNAEWRLPGNRLIWCGNDPLHDAVLGLRFGKERYAP